MSDISNSANFINLSDVTERVDELLKERAEDDKTNGTERDEGGELTGASVDEDGLPVNGTWEEENTDDAEELARLLALLDECQGKGTGHDWGGNTYPATLIAENHFADYVQSFAEDCGAISRDASWIVVDWEKTAEAMQQDYKQIDYDGEMYWCRA